MTNYLPVKIGLNRESVSRFRENAQTNPANCV